VIARTDAVDPSEAVERAICYAEAGADGVMVEAIRDLEKISELRSHLSVPIMVNQLHGGKSPNWTFNELEDAGASIVICSTPCLFAAQYGIERYLDMLLEMKRLPSENTASMDDCARVLNETDTMGHAKQDSPKKVHSPKPLHKTDRLTSSPV
jgi:2-methylisocitrate lyase-like PEP mutase family enzyme